MRNFHQTQTKANFILYFLLFFSFCTLKAQKNEISKDSTANKQKDIVDLFRITSKHLSLIDSTKHKGNGPFFSCMPAIGYTMISGLTATFVASTSFTTDTLQKRFSSILLNSNYSQYNQYWFILNSNIFYEKLKLHLVGDDRYYKFPSHTYGFGIHNKPSDALDIDYSYLRLYQVLYREITSNVFVGLGYNLDLHWNITTDSIHTKTLKEFKEFSPTTHSISSGISCNVLYDTRKNPENPQGGSYAHFQYRPNFKALASDQNWQTILFDLRYYIPFPSSSRNVLCFWNYSKSIIAGTAPYLDMPSIGWDDYSNTGRGYVPGRFTGRNLIYFETEYRMVLTRNGLFGAVVFGNAQTVFKEITRRKGTYVPGGGFGLRIKVNKHSNTNIAIDYGFGIDGSRGLIFNLGEVF